ncbi:acylphosphatase [Streptomyces sp. NPDC059740]|uniref:acylphosphatase n=1 Tax=Streptomyces sp. NPDC059740 TaxID=3346926 RepID=UPI00364A1B9A
MSTRARVIVTGAVQGVSFRDSCRRAALDARVSGWVRNRSDCAVEAVFEGDEIGVERMVSWAHHGPHSSGVEAVRVVEEEPVEGLTGFEVLPDEPTM